MTSTEQRARESRAPDRRTVRTVTAIEGALRTLLATVPLDLITVTALCKRAGVKRQSFYTHFDSVPAIAAKILTAEVDDLLPIADLGSVPVAQIEPMIVDNFSAALASVARDRELFRAVFASASSGVLRQSLEHAIRVRVVNVIRIWQEIGHAGTVDVAVAVPFATGGIVRAIEAWAASDDSDATSWARAIRDQMPSWWPRPAQLD